MPAAVSNLAATAGAGVGAICVRSSVGAGHVRTLRLEPNDLHGATGHRAFSTGSRPRTASRALGDAWSTGRRSWGWRPPSRTWKPRA